MSSRFVANVVLVLVAVLGATACYSPWSATGRLRRRYSTSWLDEERLLVAGPEFGVVALAPNGELRERWLGSHDGVLDVCALPDRSGCWLTSTRDHVAAAAREGFSPYGTAEVYALDFATRALRRITHDRLSDELLCASGGCAWVQSEAKGSGFFVGSIDYAQLRRIDLATGSASYVMDLYSAPTTANRLPGTDDILFAGPWQGEPTRVHASSNTCEPYPWIVEGTHYALRTRYERKSDPDHYDNIILELHDLQTGAATVLHDDVNYRELYDVSLSPDERFVSFIQGHGKWTWEDHRLRIVDTRSGHVTEVRLPLS